MDGKRKYLPVNFGRINVELEDCILGGSGIVTGGTGDTPYNPEIEDWGTTSDGASASGDF